MGDSHPGPLGPKAFLSPLLCSRLRASFLLVPQEPPLLTAARTLCVPTRLSCTPRFPLVPTPDTQQASLPPLPQLGIHTITSCPLPPRPCAFPDASHLHFSTTETLAPASRGRALEKPRSHWHIFYNPLGGAHRAGNLSSELPCLYMGCARDSAYESIREMGRQQPSPREGALGVRTLRVTAMQA